MKDLEIIVTHSEDKESGLFLHSIHLLTVFPLILTGEKGYVEKKKWTKITTPWGFADALFNQLIIIRAVRPWDYSIMVVVRALHCARWLGEVEQDEAKQTELLLQYYLDIMEKNINKAR